MGLSLSDQYWIRPAGMDTLRWEDLNFFHNDFDERLGKALFTGDSSRIGDVNTPGRDQRRRPAQTVDHP